MNDYPNRIIGVIGGSTCNSEECTIAEEVGRRIAEVKAFLVCGGLGGIMEAACKGAYEAGGVTIGILPGNLTDDANPYVMIPIATGMGIGRNIIIVRTAETIISISGRYGTISEISYALQLNKRVLALRPWVNIPGIEVVNSAEEAVNLAL